MKIRAFWDKNLRLLSQLHLQYPELSQENKQIQNRKKLKNL